MVDPSMFDILLSSCLCVCVHVRVLVCAYMYVFMRAFSQRALLLEPSRRLKAKIQGSRT